jgi:hypothetical protein
MNDTPNLDRFDADTKQDQVVPKGCHTDVLAKVWTGTINPWIVANPPKLLAKLFHKGESTGRVMAGDELQNHVKVGFDDRENLYPHGFVSTASAQRDRYFAASLSMNSSIGTPGPGCSSAAHKASRSHSTSSASSFRRELQASSALEIASLSEPYLPSRTALRTSATTSTGRLIVSVSILDIALPPLRTAVPWQNNTSAKPVLRCPFLHISTLAMLAGEGKPK